MADKLVVGGSTAAFYGPSGRGRIEEYLKLLSLALKIKFVLFAKEQKSGLRPIRAKNRIGRTGLEKPKG